MNIQRKNSAHHFRMQSEREQTAKRVELGVSAPEARAHFFQSFPQPGCVHTELPQSCNVRRNVL